MQGKPKINERIQIKDVDKTDPNSEGRVIEVTETGVYISNLNMPYAGTYTRHFVAFEDIVSRKIEFDPSQFTYEVKVVRKHRDGLLITMVTLLDSEGKYIKHAKLNDDLLDAMNHNPSRVVWKVNPK